MRLPMAHSLELEVSHWYPPPSSSNALRALCAELRIYAPSVRRVIFVNDFDRTIVTAVKGVCRVEDAIGAELLWRDG